ncbi:MAG: DUF460 domain-containing protein [Halobacteriota archaeon]
MNARTNALDAAVFGVDIQSGDIRGDAPSYALVTLEEEGIDRDVVSYRKLARLIDDREPSLVATDNVYELAADKDALVYFLRSLPTATSLVQVTGAERPEPLSRVASRHGVPYGKQPMKEAEAAARLAALGVGTEVTAFTNTTTVKVSRGRSTGKGGWSQDRYTRRIHGNVRKRAREVRSKLDDANLAYEMDATEKYGGYANAVFTVEATPDELPVSAHRSGDTRIEIERERLDGIEYRPLVKRRDRVIVGIDPGTTTGVAIVSLDGRVLDVHSTRTGDAADITEWIIDHGRPVIVAADVSPMPETVEKFRRSFDAAGWNPPTDIPVDQKLHRTRNDAYDNDHERDAMAAALYAYDAHEDQFERITHKTPAQVDREEVIARVVAGEASVETALAALTEDEASEPEPSERAPPEQTPEQARINALERQVDRLSEHVDTLKSTLEDREETIAEYEEALSEAKREERREARERREVARLKRETDRLERERDEAKARAETMAEKLEQLKRFWKLDHTNVSAVAAGRDLVSVKVVEQFTKGGIETADEEYGLSEGDVIYLRDASGAGRSTAQRLVDVKPRVVIRDGGLSDIAEERLFEAEIPVAPLEHVPINEIDELAVAHEDDVEAAIDDWKERAKARERERNADMVDQIISEHRADSPSR